MEQLFLSFPELTSLQIERLKQLEPLYRDWNEKINVISRKDMDNFYTHHVLHSLAIAKVIQFNSKTQILDVGTGGGFPGIPLAIMFPQCQFTLVDSIGKKIKVVTEVAQSLGLENVMARQCRVEEEKAKYDFVVSRAVTRFDEFSKLVKKNISPTQNNTLPNGILYLKGGDFAEEIAPFKDNITLYPISNYFSNPFFETKKVIHLKF